MLTIIERDLIKKPQLGGWRDKVTGVKYLNADSQTGPPPKRVPWEKTCSRKVQTVLLIEKECQSTCDHATQMWRRDCYIPSVSDKYVTVNPYETYEEMRMRVNADGRARVIQRCYRAYRILKFVKQCARLYRKLREDCDRLKEEKFHARRERYISECRALNEPRSLVDMDALVHHLQQSADLSEGRSAADLDCSPRSRGLRLLEARRRAQLAVEQRVRPARESREQRARERFLALHCRPRRWLDGKGHVVEMLSLRNQAARECWRTYEELRDWDGGDGENGSRMEILLKARSSIEHHDCKTASSFRDLVDQEIILAAKNIEQEKLDFLRKRIVGAFLQFVQTSHNCTCKSVNGNGCDSILDYEFRVPLEKNQVLCSSCRKLLPESKFPVTVRKKRIYKCKACIRLHTNVRGHVDLMPYVHLLSAIRESERTLGLSRTLADALSASDLRHLALDIWHGRSVLSGREDARVLRLPRYWAREPWSPWNCVLLAEDEAEAHCSLGEGAPGTYSEQLRRLIGTAHRTARLDFRGLVAFERRIDSEKIDDRQPAAVAATTTTTTTTTADAGCDNRSEDLIGHLEL